MNSRRDGIGRHTVPEKMHIFFDYSRKNDQNQKSAIGRAKSIELIKPGRSLICELANNNNRYSKWGYRWAILGQNLPFSLLDSWHFSSPTCEVCSRANTIFLCGSFGLDPLCDNGDSMQKLFSKLWDEILVISIPDKYRRFASNKDKRLCLYQISNM